jgi:hypothetical protein
MERLDGQIKEILSSAQYKRYHEIDLQASGPMAFGRPEVADKLELSEEQHQQIREVLETSRPKPPQPGERPDPSQMQQQRKATLAKIVALLNSEQKSKWSAMVGKPFDLSTLNPPRPGGM